MTPTQRAALALIIDRNADRAIADPVERRAWDLLSIFVHGGCYDQHARRPECRTCRVYPCPSGHHGGI